MYDSFNRRINYLRVSVTDRCNLRCTYCMPPEGVKMISHADILSYEEILEVIQMAVSMGIDKVRITGGEPLVRKGIVDFIAQVAIIHGIRDFGLTTNGILLEEFAQALSVAGLHRINISLDTMDPIRYKEITRGGELSRVLKGIAAARKAGLEPVKINCVIQNSSDEPDARAVREFCHENHLEVRFIHQMDLGEGCFTIVENGHGGDCMRCNRLRLTANGRIKPCLFSNLEFDIRKMGIKAAIEAAVGLKPEQGTVNTSDFFHNIGG
ncbi:MAG: radical SAM protein [Bacteroidetes bacterium]|nr:radical SAM protein [Bacteroidota bacterium]